MFIVTDKTRARGEDVQRFRCGEKQRAKAGEWRSLTHTVGGVGKGSRKEREVDRSPEVCEWEGYECTRESIGATSMFTWYAGLYPWRECCRPWLYSTKSDSLLLKFTPPWRGRLPRNETGVWNRTVTSHSRLVSTASDEFSMVIIGEDWSFLRTTDSIHLLHSMQI
jgi:hypothetical protein